MKLQSHNLLSPALLLLGIVASVKAEALGWKQKTIELSAHARQEKVETAFAFKNSSNKPVTIQSITASCDCTVPQLDKKIFAPGESGELKAVFKIEGRVGRQEKTITVTTDEDDRGPTVLTLRVNIPELFDVKPRLVLWRTGEETTEKAVDIYLAMNEPVKVTETKSEDPTIETRLETVVSNRQYRLFLKPISTTRTLRTVISVKTQTLQTEQIQSFNIYAHVK
jgi:hypothetical protein